MRLGVIGASFGRTGTMSLKELGFGPCYHMSEVLTVERVYVLHSSFP